MKKNTPPREPIFRFTIPVPVSSKNRQRVMRRGRRAWIAKGAQAEAQHTTIKRAALAALAEWGPRPDLTSLFGDDNLEMQIEHDVELDLLHVTVRSLGPRPGSKVKTGRKRDLQNLQDAVCDALQGVVYDNDNQIDLLTMKRTR